VSPFSGSLFTLALLSTLFITTNLAIGYTFSTMCRTSCRRCSSRYGSFFRVFYASASCFRRGHAGLAQYIGGPAADAFRPHRPRHHAEGATIQNLQYDTLALIVLMAAGDDDRGNALPSYARLMYRPREGRAMAWFWQNQERRGLGGIGLIFSAR